MENVARRRWGLVACVLLAAALVLALVPQGAWAEAAAEVTDAASQAGTTQAGDAGQDGASNQGDDSKDADEADKAGDDTKDQGSSKDAQDTDTNGQQGEDGGSQERETPAPAKRSLARAPMAATANAGSDASAHVHCTITSSETIYLTGDTGELDVSYTVDYGTVKAGDTLTVGAKGAKVKVYASKQHFPDQHDNGDGTWTLTFGEDGATALSGTFTMFVTMADTSTETTVPVEAGNDSLSVTVRPRSPEGGSTTSGGYLDPTRVIIKDLARTDGIDKSGWDTSTGDTSTLYTRDLTNAVSSCFRIVINEKQVAMTDATVVDTLPEGMTFDTSDVVVEYFGNDGKAETVPAGNYELSRSGNTLTFKYKGTTNRAVRLLYWATSPAGSNGTKLVNRADLTYTSDGTAYTDHALSALQGINYSAANGTKMVDKTELYLDDDQQVTYTFKFWNNNGFKAGEISLKDKLDASVGVVLTGDGQVKQPFDNDKFKVTWDESEHCVYIVNSQDITKDDLQYVGFVTDFSKVAGDQDVTNRVLAVDPVTHASGTYEVYGNTVKTHKYKLYRVSHDTGDTTDDTGKTDDTDDTGKTDGTDDTDKTNDTDDTGNDSTTTKADDTDKGTSSTSDNSDKGSGTTDGQDESRDLQEGESTARQAVEAAQAPQQASAPKADAQESALPQTGDATIPVLPILVVALIDLAVFLSLRSRRE